MTILPLNLSSCPASTRQESITPKGGANIIRAPRNEVMLSPEARQMSSLLDESSDIDPSRVLALRDAISAGRLQMDASRIADSLLASARELLT
jgi:negative regulator of flagellin synthesis FlgM